MMKKWTLSIFALLLCLALCACGSNDTSVSETTTDAESETTAISEESEETEAIETSPTTDAANTTDTTEEQTATQSTDMEADTEPVCGTRSNPYEFGDEIVIYAKPGSLSGGVNYTAEYTFCFNEVWGSSKVQSEYPSYTLMDNRILIRGTLTVACDETEDSMVLNISPTFITETFNEETAIFDTYKPNKFNNGVFSVYSGGTYDVIVISSGDVDFTELSYLTLTYTNENNEFSTIWVRLPETSIEVSEEDEINDVDYETDSSVIVNEENTESENEDDAADNNSVETLAMTKEELDAALLTQPMYVVSTKYVVQDERYKALYPDMLQAIIKNNSGTDVKDAVVAFAAWDSNDFPVKIYGKYSLGSGSYIRTCNFDDINMLDGSTFGDGYGMSLDSDTDNIATFKAIVVSYDDFDGNTWSNPYYSTWVELYEDKKLN